MDVLRAAADTIERAPADRGAEPDHLPLVAAIEQSVTDLSVQLARAFALIAGAASTLEDIAGGQPRTVAQARASHLREALALAQSSGLIDTPTACVHDCGRPCTSSRLCQPPADRHPGARLEDGEEVMG